jgi:hypothetical protein
MSHGNIVSLWYQKKAYGGNDMKKLSSKYCLPICDGKGCYDTKEYRLIGGKSTLVRVSHCKKRNNIHRRIV